VLHLLELPRTLRRPLANERKHMSAWLGREAERVADAARRKVGGAWVGVGGLAFVLQLACVRVGREAVPACLCHPINLGLFGTSW
jgi:hypothetical protein